MEEQLHNIFGQYVSPASTLLKAIEIEGRGPQIPVLLDKAFSKFYVPPSWVPIEEYNASITRVEQLLIESSLEEWQAEVRLLQLLQNKGSLGVVDYVADESLRLQQRNFADLGRQRFHNLHTAAIT